MSIRNLSVLAVAVGSAIAASSAFAGPPVAFGSTFSTAGNVITLGGCPAGYFCDTTPITDTGFVQRVIQNATTGVSYVQTVLADTGFVNEDWIIMNGSVNGGLAGRQTIDTGAVGGTQFTSSATIITGTMKLGTEATTSIDQNVDMDTTVAGVQGQNFNYTHVTSDLGTGAAITAGSVSGLGATALAYTAGAEMSRVRISNNHSSIGTFGFEKVGLVVNNAQGASVQEFSLVDSTPGVQEAGGPPIWATYTPAASNPFE